MTDGPSNDDVRRNMRQGKLSQDGLKLASRRWSRSDTELQRLRDGIRAQAEQKERHARALREEGDGEHCDGFAEALDDEVRDLRALLGEGE